MLHRPDFPDLHHYEMLAGWMDVARLDLLNSWMEKCCHKQIRPRASLGEPRSSLVFKDTSLHNPKRSMVLEPRASSLREHILMTGTQDGSHLNGHHRFVKTKGVRIHPFSPLPPHLPPQAPVGWA